MFHQNPHLFTQGIKRFVEILAREAIALIRNYLLSP